MLSARATPSAGSGWEPGVFPSKSGVFGPVEVEVGANSVAVFFAAPCWSPFLGESWGRESCGKKLLRCVSATCVQVFSI